jgi:hypothetical protein
MAASSLLASNRFYTPYSDDPRLVPNLGVPQASYRLPEIPNYSAYPTPQARYLPQDQQQSSGGQPPQERYRRTGTSPRSQAEIDYQIATGYWPQEDPNFSEEIYRAHGGRIGTGQNIRDARAQQVEEAMMRGLVAREQWMAPPPAYDFELERGYYE